LLLFLLAAGSARANSLSPEAEAKSRAYYHFALGHYYEELAGPFRRSAYLREAIDHYKKALQYDPSSTQVVIQLAEAYRTSGSIRDAVVEARQLLEKNPDNLAAHRLLGRIYFQTLGEMEPATPAKDTLRLAIEEYEHITRLTPDDTDAWLTLARLHRMNSDLDATEAALKEVLAREPQSEVALATLAALYTDRGQHEKATELLEAAAEGTSSSRLLGALGYSYDQAGEIDKAIEAYRRALTRESDHFEIRRRLADALLRAERYDEAIVEYQAIIDADPGDAEAYLRLSQLFRFQRRFAEARATLQKAKKAAPDNLEIGFNEALLHEAEGNYDAAVAVLSDMLARMTKASGDYNPREQHGRSVVLERLGATYRRMEQFDEGAKVFEMMLALNEDAARRGYAQIAETYRQARLYDQGIEALRQARERFPDDRDFVVQLAMLTSESGALEPAAELLRSLLDEGGDPDLDRQVHMALAQIFERHKRWPDAEAAINDAEHLVSTESQLEFVYFLRGAIYERQKRYDEAEEQFRQALEMNPDSAITLNYLGYMFADQNMKLEESVELLKRAVALEPNNGAYLDSLGWAYYRLEKLELAEKYRGLCPPGRQDQATKAPPGARDPKPQEAPGVTASRP
jgi:tetratricopeptide (TPR) repeat protein